jgi:hypothetical protein
MKSSPFHILQAGKDLAFSLAFDAHRCDTFVQGRRTVLGLVCAKVCHSRRSQRAHGVEPTLSQEEHPSWLGSEEDDSLDRELTIPEWLAYFRGRGIGKGEVIHTALRIQLSIQPLQLVLLLFGHIGRRVQQHAPVFLSKAEQRVNHSKKWVCHLFTLFRAEVGRR